MNKKQKIYLGIGVGLAALVGGYFWYKNRKPKSDVLKDSEAVNDAEKTKLEQSAIKTAPSSVPFSKIETTQVKIQPIQPLLTSGADVIKRKLYAQSQGVKIYNTSGKVVGKTVKNEYLGLVGKTERMANGIYWVYFKNSNGQVLKITSNAVNVEA